MKGLRVRPRQSSLLRSIDSGETLTTIYSVSASLQRPLLNSDEPCGRDRLRTARATGAEGATAPETLRQKDRRGMRLWKAAAP